MAREVEILKRDLAGAAASAVGEGASVLGAKAPTLDLDRAWAYRTLAWHSLDLEVVVGLSHVQVPLLAAGAHQRASPYD